MSGSAILAGKSVSSICVWKSSILQMYFTSVFYLQIYRNAYYMYYILLYIYVSSYIHAYHIYVTYDMHVYHIKI